jgi:hypothetical protein
MHPTTTPTPAAGADAAPPRFCLSLRPPSQLPVDKRDGFDFQLFDAFDGAADRTVTQYFPFLFRAYPHSKVILATRNADAWLKSMPAAGTKPEANRDLRGNSNTQLYGSTSNADSKARGGNSTVVVEEQQEMALPLAMLSKSIRAVRKMLAKPHIQPGQQPTKLLSAILAARQRLLRPTTANHAGTVLIFSHRFFQPEVSFGSRLLA